MKRCPACGRSNNDDSRFCYSCGENLENVPVQITADDVPLEIKGWNMGAFMHNILWGIANGVYEALWSLVVIIPFVGWFAAIGIWIWLGLKGNELAWKKQKWDTVEDFKRCQGTWNRAGWFTLIVTVGLSIVYFIIFIFFGMAVALAESPGV